MKDKDRLAKAERKLEEHRDVCKRCEESIYDVTIGKCTIAFQLMHNRDKIKKQIEKK